MGPATYGGKVVFAAAAFALLAMTPVLCAQTPNDLDANATMLKDIRFWQAGDVIRVALETDPEITYKYGRLDNPDRIFIDLTGVRPAKGMRTIPVGDGVIKQIRVALTQPGVTRVVLDLEKKAEFTTSQLGNPNRVILELKRPGGVSVVSQVQAPAPVVTSDGNSKPFQYPRTAASRPVSTSLNMAAPPKVIDADYSLPARFALRFPPRVVAPGRAKDSMRVEAPAPVAARIPPPSPVIVTAPPKQATNITADLREPKPAQTDKLGNRSLTRVLGLKLERVVLDAGHGGHDTGTISKGGLEEKDLVLDVTMRLGKLIEETLGAEVVYTRDDDTFIPLGRRTQIANEKRADLFLSVHANSSSAKSISGTETYFLNFTSSSEDMDVASRENAGSDQSIHDLQDLVKKIALQTKVEESREFAQRIQAATHELAVASNGRIRNRGVKKAPFVVLIGADMPSVLCEIGFLTNVREEALMKKPEHRQKIAEALLKGISRYAESLSHFTVAQRQ